MTEAEYDAESSRLSRSWWSAFALFLAWSALGGAVVTARLGLPGLFLVQAPASAAWALFVSRLHREKQQVALNFLYAQAQRRRGAA